jgi:hypothetical protein
MADPLRVFRAWIGANEVDSAVVRTASVEESLGLVDSSLTAEVERIGSALARAGHDPAHPCWRWATDPGSYPSVVDAHLQYLALWFAEHASRALPHLAVDQPTALAAVLRSRKRTPYINDTTLAGYAFVAVPAGFLVSVDLYFRAHFRLRDLGRQAPELPGEGCVGTDAIGGQACERAINHSWSAANEALLQLQSSLLAAELFDPDLDDGPLTAKPFDLYDPELIRSTGAQVRRELTGRGAGDGPLQPSSESQAATYLCLLFALFHELAHQLVGDDGVEMARAMGITETDEHNAIEAAVDLVALPAYAGFVDEHSRVQPTNSPIAAVIHPARFSLGPSAFHSVGKAVELAEWAFYSTQAEAQPRRDKRDRAKRESIMALQRRQVVLANKLWPMIENSAQGTLDRWHLLCYGTFFEARCVETALRMMLDRLRYRKSSRFCEHYEG